MKVLHSICQQIWKTQQWPQDWKRSVFIPIPKKGNAKECSNYRTIADQGTLKSLLQHHSSKASILWCSAFFIVQLSHPYVTTRKTIALTRWIFVGKVMSLLFNMLSRLVITFLSRSKSFNFMGAITICSDFGAQKNEVCHCFHCLPINLL